MEIKHPSSIHNKFKLDATDSSLGNKRIFYMKNAVKRCVQIDGINGNDIMVGSYCIAVQVAELRH